MRVAAPRENTKNIPNIVFRQAAVSQDLLNFFKTPTVYILNNPDGLSPKQAVGTFTIAQGTMPSVLCFSETSQLDDAAVLEAKENCIIPFLEESNKYVIPGTLSFSSEKDAERRAAMADIETYVDEMVMKFITGREPIENWDTYVAKVKEMGIENVIGIYQEALDAWNS